jgi:hypothetical protein
MSSNLRITFIIILFGDHQNYVICLVIKENKIKKEKLFFIKLKLINENEIFKNVQ